MVEKLSEVKDLRKKLGTLSVVYIIFMIIIVTCVILVVGKIILCLQLVVGFMITFIGYGYGG
jgi:hypothetical protein